MTNRKEGIEALRVRIELFNGNQHFVNVFKEDYLDFLDILETEDTITFDEVFIGTVKETNLSTSAIKHAVVIGESFKFGNKFFPL